MAIALASCATSNDGAVIAPIIVAAPKINQNAFVRRALPPPPAYAFPVKVADPLPTDDAFLVAARERIGRIKANERIAAFARWYAQVRLSYAH